MQNKFGRKFGEFGEFGEFGTQIGPVQYKYLSL